VVEDDKYVELRPIKNPQEESINIDMSIDFPHSAIGKQHILYNSKIKNL
jgi:UDP-3-O-acyl-N-acetylglucosamine deacetylase